MDKENIYSDKWEMVIGLEVHVQLNSKTKMFTPTNWSYGESQIPKYAYNSWISRYLTNDKW